MTLISVRKNLFKEIDLKKFYEVTDSDFRYIYTYTRFEKMLKDIRITKKTIGQYDRAISEFLIFLELIDIKLSGVIDSDLELYKDILLRRNNNKRATKTKIYRISLYLWFYKKINEVVLIETDYSTNTIEKMAIEMIKDTENKIKQLRNNQKDIIK